MHYYTDPITKEIIYVSRRQLQDKIDDYQKNADIRQSLINQYQRQIENLKKDINGYKNELSQLNKTNKEQQQVSQQQNQEIQKFKREIQSQQALTTQLKQSQAKLEQEKSKIQNCNDDLQQKYQREKNENKTNQAQIQNLVTKNKSLETQVDQQNKQIKNLAEEKKDLQNKLNEAIKQQENYKDESSQLQKDKKAQQQQLEDQKQQYLADIHVQQKQNQVLQKNLEKKQQEYDKITNQKNKEISDLRNTVQETKQKNVDHEAQINELKKEIEKYQNSHEKIILQHIRDKTFEEYDVEITYDSLQDLNGKVYFKKNPKIPEEVHQEFANQEVFMTGLFGKHNAGKSFLLSKILGKTYSQGQQQKTKGFNLIYPTEDLDQMCFIDTRGSGEPLSLYEELDYYRNNQTEDRNKFYEIQKQIEKQKKQAYLNQKASEKYSQNFVSKKSDIILFVVNILDSEQATQITRLVETTREQGQDLFIIHNFNTLESIDAVKKQIKEDIINNFQLGKKAESQDPGTKCHFYKQALYGNQNNKSTSNVIHLVLGQESKESGNFYNEKTYKFLKSKLSCPTANSREGEYFEEKFQKFNNEYLSQFLEIEKDPKELEKLQNFVIDEDDKGTYLHNPNLKEGMSKIKDLTFNFWGDIFTKDAGNELNYKICQDDKKIQIFLSLKFIDFINFEEVFIDLQQEQLHYWIVKVKFEYNIEQYDKFLQEQGYDTNQKLYAQNENEVKLGNVEGQIELINANLTTDNFHYGRSKEIPSLFYITISKMQAIQKDQGFNNKINKAKMLNSQNKITDDAEQQKSQNFVQ